MNLETPWSLSSSWTLQTITSSTGHLIRLGIWQAQESKNASPGKTVYFINGRNEFIEKYSHLPEDLKKKGVSRFITWDHPGQGRSDGKRSHIESFDEFSLTAKDVIEATRTHSEEAYDMIAHSMGGLIALYGTMKGFFQPAKILLSSPFVGIPETIANKYLARPLCSVMVHSGLGKFYTRLNGTQPPERFLDNPRTHSSVRFYRLMAAPFMGKSITFSWAHAAFQAIDYIHSKTVLETFKTPVIILQAENETVVSSHAMEAWTQKARSLGCLIKLTYIQKAKHELLYEDAEIYQHVVEEFGEELLRSEDPSERKANLRFHQNSSWSDPS